MVMFLEAFVTSHGLASIPGFTGMCKTFCIHSQIPINRYVIGILEMVISSCSQMIRLLDSEDLVRKVGLVCV